MSYEVLFAIKKTGNVCSNIGELLCYGIIKCTNLGEAISVFNKVRNYHGPTSTVPGAGVTEVKKTEMVSALWGLLVWNTRQTPSK